MKQLATATVPQNIQLLSDKYECFTDQCIGQDDFLLVEESFRYNKWDSVTSFIVPYQNWAFNNFLMHSTQVNSGFQGLLQQQSIFDGCGHRMSFDFNWQYQLKQEST